MADMFTDMDGFYFDGDDENENENGVPDDIVSLLSSSDRDFLIRKNGDQVKIDSLKGKKVGLFFAKYCPGGRVIPTLMAHYTELVVDVYDDLAPKGDFEIVLVSGDSTEELFECTFSKMPWLAIPFTDLQTRLRLRRLSVRHSTRLVIFGENGEVLTTSGIQIIQEFEAEGYPFTPERIKELDEPAERARREHSLSLSLSDLLTYRTRDYVISSDGNKVPISVLEGKTVGLYFSSSLYRSFTGKLVDVYNKVKAKGECFEIVMVPLDGLNGKDGFEQSFRTMPWFSLPYMDRKRHRLARYFQRPNTPSLVIIGPDGKILNWDATEGVEKLGVQAYPFTAEKLEEARAEAEAHILETLLVLADRDSLIAKDGAKIRPSDLSGKNILLHFSQDCCPRCCAFLPKLIEAYNKIKAKDDAFEVVSIASAWDQDSFDESFAGLPWLVIPFLDAKMEVLFEYVVESLPLRLANDIHCSLIALGPTGRIVTVKARELVSRHGADAYPFTDERLEEICGRSRRGRRRQGQENKDMFWRGIQNSKEGGVYDGRVIEINCA